MMKIRLKFGKLRPDKNGKDTWRRNLRDVDFWRWFFGEKFFMNFGARLSAVEAICLTSWSLQIGRSAESTTHFSSRRRTCKRIWLCWNTVGLTIISRSTNIYATANTVNLNFYDKYAQLQSKSYLTATKIESAKNILRLEVQCKADYLQKLRKKFAINPLTFPADENLPMTLKNPCELLSEDFQRSKIISNR